MPRCRLFFLFLSLSLPLFYFLLLFLLQSLSDSLSCLSRKTLLPGEEERAGGRTIRELVQGVTENEETPDGGRSERKRRRERDGESPPTSRLVSSRTLVPQLPSSLPLFTRRDFSFFGTRPPLCLFQYALLTLRRPPFARSRSSTFQLDIFNSFPPFFFCV